VASDAERYRLQGVAFDGYLTWLRIADEVERLGFEQAGAHWRVTAVTPNAPARLRALHELQVFLENLTLGQGSMHALTDATVKAYAQINFARSRLTQFLQLVGKDHRIRELGSDETAWPYPQDKLKDTLWSLNVQVHWLVLEAIDKEYGCELTIEPSARWLTDELDGAVLYAGFYFAISHGRLPQSLTGSAAFCAGLHMIGAVMAPQTGRQAKCVKVLPLTTIVDHSDALSDQVEFAASWAAEAFDELSAIGL